MTFWLVAICFRVLDQLSCCTLFPIFIRHAEMDDAEAVWIMGIEKVAGKLAIIGLGSQHTASIQMITNDCSRKKAKCLAVSFHQRVNAVEVRGRQLVRFSCSWRFGICRRWRHECSLRSTRLRIWLHVVR